MGRVNSSARFNSPLTLSPSLLTLVCHNPISLELFVHITGHAPLCDLHVCVGASSPCGQFELCKSQIM